MRTPIRHVLASAAAASLLLTACSTGSNVSSGSNGSATNAGSAAVGSSAGAAGPSGASATGGAGSAGATSGNSGSSAANSGTAQATVVPNPTGNSRPTSIAGTPGSGCIPTQVQVPSVGITEPIVAMGTNSQGQIYPPAHTTMWYDASPQPGADGVSVIAGHVTYDGPDDFYNLDRVQNAAPVTIHCSNGRVLSWKVSEKQSVLKTALQTDQRVWGGSSTPVVALITCDRASKVVGGHHLNNYVVWVRPA